MDGTNGNAITTNSGAITQASTAVIWINHGIVNSYIILDAELNQWVLVDAGMPTSFARILRTAELHFGKGSKPTAIILTHGHFDHVGSVRKLADYWGAPVYAHPLELPYLTGRSSYPPADPLAGGGFMALVASRFFSRGPIDLGARVHPLPSDGSVPGLPDWRWLHTPGHAPGHISLWNQDERALVVGDAFVTTQQESALSVITQRHVVSRPPGYFTPDWLSAGSSVNLLASLNADYAGTGHGRPMRGDQLREELSELAKNFWRFKPARSRYSNTPALADESGFISVPPAPHDPWPKIAAVALAGVALCALASRLRRRARTTT